MGVNEIHQLLQRSNKGEICHNFIVDAQEDISKAIFFIRIMGFQRLLLFGFMYAMVMPSSSLKLLNLRRYRAEGTVGRFVVPREKLEVVIRDRSCLAAVPHNSRWKKLFTGTNFVKRSLSDNQIYFL